MPRCHIFKVSEVSRCSGVWGVKVFKLLSHDVSPGAVVGGQEVARGGVHQLPGEGLLGEAHLVVGVAHKLGSETLVSKTSHLILLSFWTARAFIIQTRPGKHLS